MDKLERLREFAIENDNYCDEIRKLKECIQSQKEYREMVNTEQGEKWEPSRKWGIFCVIEILLAWIITKGVSILMTLSTNQWMTQNQFVAAGGFGYRIVEIPFFVGAVIALPFAFLAFRVVKRVSQRRMRQSNESRVRQNENSRKVNESIREQNEKIAEQNYKIAKEIAMADVKRGEMLSCLETEFPQYPVEYLTVQVVDYIKSQMQTGQAQSINQALVHYEAEVTKES